MLLYILLMHPTINTLIFDCFGVICDPLLMGWYKEKSTRYNFTDPTFRTMLDAFNLGTITEEDVINHFLTYKDIPSCTREQLRREIESQLHINESLVALIQQLKKQGYTIVLLTNANMTFFETQLYPKYPYFKTLFDDMIISSSVNMIKPHKDIFLYTLQKINKRPEEILFIDDTKENIDAAQELGIGGLIFTDTEQCKDYLHSKGIRLDI
jgi:putative hydrolase of the HAD superfamily